MPSVSGTSLPNCYAVTVGTANQLGAPPNSQRSAIQFINNSGSGGQFISISPTNVYTIASGTTPATVGQNSLPAGQVTGPTQGAPSQNAPGSITLAPGQTYTVDSSGGVSCTGAWNASSSLPGGSLTVLES